MRLITTKNELVKAITKLMKYRISQKMKNAEVLNLGNIQIVYADYFDYFHVFYETELILEVRKGEIVQYNMDAEMFNILSSLVTRRMIKSGIH